MEKYFIGVIENGYVVAFKAENKERLIKRTYECLGMKIEQFTKELKEEDFQKWNDIKIEIP